MHRQDNPKQILLSHGSGKKTFSMFCNRKPVPHQFLQCVYDGHPSCGELFFQIRNGRKYSAGGNLPFSYVGNDAVGYLLVKRVVAVFYDIFHFLLQQLLTVII